MSLEEDLLQKFNLKSLRPDERKAVESAASRQEKRTGKRINRSDTAAVIQSYMSRIREILDREDPTKREQGLTQLKALLHEQLLISPDHPVFAVSSESRMKEIIEAQIDQDGRRIDTEGKPYKLSHFDKLIIGWYEEGRGLGTVTDEGRAQEVEDRIEEQRLSLNAWIDYLGEDTSYSDELKYWAFRSMLKMGRYDKERRKFTNREGAGSISPFPYLNMEALWVVLGDMEKKYAGKESTYQFTSRYDIDTVDDTAKERYRAALKKENFAEAYALAIDVFKPIPEKYKRITKGKWVPYLKGSAFQKLTSDIAEYGTGWCLRGEPKAKEYLERNNLYIYYSRKEEDDPDSAVVPRVALVEDERGSLTQVRGIEQHEHLDAYIGDVVEEKLQEHPDGQKYKKKTADMKRLTTIERTTKQNQPLTREDLLFLYEVDSRIEGFGYENAGRDSRIEEIRGQRNPKEDMPIIFNCTPNQIAWSPADIKIDTKAYIGKIEEGLFDHLDLYGIEHVYTSFPEGRIRLDSLEIGSMTAEQLEQALEDADIKTSPFSKSMLRNKKQFIDPVNKRQKELKGETETLDLARLRVRDLGFTRNPTARELLGEFDAEGNLIKKGRIHELGFELCPPETGPYQRLADTDQQIDNWYFIYMQPVAGFDGHPYIFRCERHEDGSWLDYGWASPGRHWSLDREIVLRRRKSAAETSATKFFLYPLYRFGCIRWLRRLKTLLAHAD